MMKLSIKIALLGMLVMTTFGIYGVRVDVYNHTPYVVEGDVSFACAGGGSHPIHCDPATPDQPETNDYSHWNGCNHNGMYVTIKRPDGDVHLSHTNFTIESNVWYQVLEDCSYQDRSGKKHNCYYDLVYSKGHSQQASDTGFFHGETLSGGTVDEVKVP